MPSLQAVTLTLLYKNSRLPWLRNKGSPMGGGPWPITTLLRHDTPVGTHPIPTQRKPKKKTQKTIISDLSSGGHAGKKRQHPNVGGITSD